MKNLTTLIVVTFLFAACGSSQQRVSYNPVAQHYFDENGHALTAEQFLQRRSRHRDLMWTIPDSVTQRLIKKPNRKGLANTDSIQDILGQRLNKNLSHDRPTIIVYYPGPDPCSIFGTAQNASQRYRWYKDLEKKCRKLAPVDMLYLYKEKRGLKTLHKIDWQPDSQQLIEKHFLKHHYPCNSYVILYHQKFIRHFGEFGKVDVLKDLTAIMN